jgi:NAD(P)-dependent dehydrogenase (short-subunit alcohol dehydrogenase family)
MIDRLFSLKGKTALVTGGAHGLGRMISAGLVEAGARVLLTSRKADAAARTASEISADMAKGFAADLTTAEGCTDLAKRVMAETERLDILVNNAGRTWGAPLESFPDKGWSSVMPINIQSPFVLVRDLLPALKAAASATDPARVINIGSLAGKAVEPLSAYSYSASKAALHHLTRVLAADLAQHRIAVNCIVPGYFPTDMTQHMRNDEATMKGLLDRVPLKRMGQPDDIVGACVFLASHASAYMTGAELVIDGGMAGCR